MMENLLSDRLVEAAGWAVIHSLWQGALVAILLALTLAAIGKKRSELRYLLSFSALAACLLAFIGTFAWYWGASANVLVEGTAGTATGSGGTSHYGPFTNAISLVEGQLPLVFKIWIIGFGFLLLRMSAGLVYTRRLVRNMDPQIPAELQSMVDKMKLQLRLKGRLLIGLSGKVSTACVVGVFKPAILMPIGMVNGLSTGEVEAILAHEIAHIARRDYLFNLLQSFIEAVLYFNPAVWWISSEVKNSREHCCDDFAIKICGSELAYARALVKAEELKKMPALSRPVALSFLGGKEKLIHRIKRILHQPDKNPIAMEKILFSAGLLFCMLFLSAFEKTTNSPQIDAGPDKRTIEYMIPELAALDSVAPRVIEKITKREGEKEVQATYENGELRELKVDGVEVPESERDQYRETLDELQQELDRSDEHHLRSAMELRELGRLKSMGELKVFDQLHQKEMEVLLRKLRDGEYKFEFPPLPDMPPVPPPAPDALDAPDAVPPPPAPSHFRFNHHSNSYKVETEEMEDGKIKVRIRSGDAEPMEIEIDSDSEVIVIDGEEVKAGDAVRIMDENFKNGAFSFDMPEGQWQELIEDNQRIIEHHLGEEMKIRQYKLRRHTDEMNEAIEEMENAQIREYKMNEEEMQQRLKEHKMQEVQLEKMNEIHEKMEKANAARAYSRSSGANSGHAVVSPGSAYFFHNQSLDDRIGHELIEDGIIEEGEEYSLKMNGNKLKVNGKRLSDELHQKYMEMYEERTGTDVSKSKIIIEN